MHKMFSDWYQIAQPVADRETIERRWTATEQCLLALTASHGAGLATYIARSSPEPPNWFLGAHKASDDVMRTRGAEEELRVLAAIVLRIALEGEDRSVASVAALSLLTGAFGMKSEPSWLKEHLRASAGWLSNEGLSARTVLDASTAEPAPSLESLQAALGVTQQRMDVITEANNCLWWAFSKHSSVLDEVYRGLPIPVMALTAPADLFRYMRSIPASPEAETLLLTSLLELSGDLTASFSLKSYISSLGRERAQKLASPLPVDCGLLCPLMWSLTAQVSPKPWQADFEKSFKFKVTTTFALPSVSIQLLRELSLSKLLAQ